MFPTCPDCDPPTLMVITDVPPAMRCPGCGRTDAFTRRPLLLITGAPGAGKSDLAKELAPRFDNLPVFDTDLFGVFCHPDWSAWANGWLLVAHGLAQGGQPSVMCGFGLHRWKIQELETRPLIGPIWSLNLDVADDELRLRLRRRPPSRKYDSARIERKLAESARFREDADRNIETAGLTVAEIADLAERWVRDQLDLLAP